jgi:oxalate decarboxylase/phosphoglucose isomerase-like protein (cupin superfamily)
MTVEARVSYAATVSYREDHVRVQTPCGPLTEILGNKPVPVSIALVENIRTTVPHYHRDLDEVYFVLQGTIGVRLFDPDSGTSTDIRLGKHEACVIPRGTHHQVVCSSEENLLCALCVPQFNRQDDHTSDAGAWVPAEQLAPCP